MFFCISRFYRYLQFCAEIEGALFSPFRKLRKILVFRNISLIYMGFVSEFEKRRAICITLGGLGGVLARYTYYRGYLG